MAVTTLTQPPASLLDKRSKLDWRTIDWTYTGYGPLRAGAWGAAAPPCVVRTPHARDGRTGGSSRFHTLS